jgi:hypothetical protein
MSSQARGRSGGSRPDPDPRRALWLLSDLLIFDSTKSDQVGQRVEGRLHISISPLAIHAEILYPFCQSILSSVSVAVVTVTRDHDEYGRNGLQIL